MTSNCKYMKQNEIFIEKIDDKFHEFLSLNILLAEFIPYDEIELIDELNLFNSSVDSKIRSDAYMSLDMDQQAFHKPISRMYSTSKLFNI